MIRIIDIKTTVVQQDEIEPIRFTRYLPIYLPIMPFWEDMTSDVLIKGVLVG